MSVPRLSARYCDLVDECGDEIAEFVRAVAVFARGTRPSDDAIRLCAQGERLLASFARLQVQAMAIDDALRAIGAIAQAGRDTPKIRRTLREIVADQIRLAKNEQEIGDACRR